MRVLAHPDPFVLERELVDRVVAAQAGNPFAGVLVIVPTSRLGEHVRRRLAERCGAFLNVDVFQYRLVARRIFEDAGTAPPNVASTQLLEALLARVLRNLPDNPWSRYAARRPGALGGILGALRDLREAGIEPATTAAELDGSERERAFARVHAGYVDGLARAAASGLTDEAGFIASCLDNAPAYARRYRAIVHHGAYELIGVHLDLLRALDRTVPMDVLLPVEPGSEATASAERFAARHLLEDGESLARIEGESGSLLGSRLPALFRETERPRAPEPGRVRFHTAQGAAAEIEFNLRESIAAVGDDTRPEEIALIARTLSPYETEIGAALGQDDRVRASSSLATPLRREPVVRDLLTLLRVIADDFPRAATADLLCSPRLNWKAILPDDPRPPVDLADSWSRRAGLVGGLDEWTRDLPGWAQNGRTELAGRIAAAVRALRDTAGEDPTAGWVEHAGTVETIVRNVLPGPAAADATVTGELLDLLDEMRLLPAVTGSNDPVPFDDMVRWLERAADGTRTRLSPDEGGVRILDAMQARGMTFRRVFLMGLHAGLFPRPIREDPFLPDEARERLRAATGRPLSVKSDGEAEERLLLSLMLGSAGERLDVSWQRADESGREKSSSLALREIARLTLGSPDMKTAIDSAHRIPSHPTQLLEDVEKRSGLLSDDDELLLVALRGGSGPDDVTPLLDRRPDLRFPLAMLSATESFAPRDLSFDGRIAGAPDGPASSSVSALETLGKCPLQFFFRHRLGVRELDPDTDPAEIAIREMGSHIHSLLENLYRRLLDEGAFEGREDALLERARALLGDLFADALGAAATRMQGRFPVLWEIESAGWRAALERFLEADLSRIAGNHLRLRALEESLSDEVDFGNGVAIELRARLDRVLESGTERLVGDYKTHGNLANRVNLSEMLKGSTLQVPLYRRLTGAAVEILGVGPGYRIGGDSDDHRVVFDGFDKDSAEQGFDETIRELIGLDRGGRYPMAPGRQCVYCPYESACRRLHPPSVDRGEIAPDTRRYRLLKRKNRYKPRIADWSEESE